MAGAVRRAKAKVRATPRSIDAVILCSRACLKSVKGEAGMKTRYGRLRVRGNDAEVFMHRRVAREEIGPEA